MDSRIILMLLTFVLSVMLATVVIPRIILIAMRKKLFDMPNERKVHTRAIPRLGGVAFFPVSVFSFLFVMSLSLLARQKDGEGASLLPILPEVSLFVCGMIVLYLTGIADDLSGLRYRTKFYVQLLCAALLPLSGVWVNNLYGLFGIHELPAAVGMVLTVFLVVFVTNAVNLIDGIDGLASGLGIVALLVFAVLFYDIGDAVYSTLATAMLGVLIPFFYYNVFGSAEKAKKIFMGDTGSLTLGCVLSVWAIKYRQAGGGPGGIDGGPVFRTAFSTLIIPMFDVVRVVLVRLRNGKNPFLPDRNHIHHKFLDMGFSTRQAMVFLLCLACAFSVANILLIRCINHTLLFFADVLVWTGLNLYWDKRRETVHV